jgi:hypothetical protein
MVDLNRVKKINSQCANEFKVDLNYLLYHNDIQLVKDVYTNENNTEKTSYELAYFVNYSYYVKNVTLKLIKSNWIKTNNDVWVNNTGVEFVTLETNLKRKNTSLMVEYSKKLSLNDINKKFAI